MHYERDFELFAEALELLERNGGDRFLKTLFEEQIAVREWLLAQEQRVVH